MAADDRRADPGLPLDPEIRSSRDPQELLAAIRSRGRILGRRRRLKRLGQRALPVALAGVLVVGALLVRGDGTGPGTSDVETRPGPVEDQPIGPAGSGAGGGGGTPGPAAPSPSATASTPVPGTGRPVTGGHPGAGTTSAADPSPRYTVVIEQGDPQLGYRTLVLDPGRTRPRVLLDRSADRRYPTLSPAGTTVAFEVATPLTITFDGIQKTWDVYTVPVAGGRTARLTTASLRSGRGSEWPTWVGDGEIVYECPPEQVGHTSLCSMAADGTDQHLLQSADAPLYLPVPSPDGRRVVLLHDVAGAAELWLMDPTGEQPAHRVGAKPFRRTDMAAFWSQDGRRAYIVQQGLGSAPGSPSAGSETGRLISVDVTTGDTSVVAGLPPMGYATPCTDGRIAFVTSTAFGPAAPGDLVVSGLDGGRPQVLLRGAGSLPIPTSCVAAASP